MTRKNLMTEFEPGHGFTQEDWDEVKEAEAESTDEELAQFRPMSEAMPDLYAALQEEIARRPGRPKSPAPKVQVSLRLDPDVLDKFRATGKGWQGRVNAALRAAKL